LGLAALGLAVLGVIDVLVRVGLYLESKIQEYRHADDTVKAFRLIIQSMIRCQIHSQVTIITIYSKDSNVDDVSGAIFTAVHKLGGTSGRGGMAIWRRQVMLTDLYKKLLPLTREPIEKVLQLSYYRTNLTWASSY
jgi:hypothetical protein